MEFLFENLFNFTWQQLVMCLLGGLLIYLAIKKEMEPTLLLPLGFGAILVNLPLSGAIDQMVGDAVERGALSVLFDAGITNELFPLILFIGIGAMIDFGPLLSNPKLMIFGAAASSAFSSRSALLRYSSPSTMRHQSPSSALPTARLQSLLLRSSIRSISAQLWLRHIHTWRLFP